MSWDLFSQAVSLHRQGKLDDAGRLCLRMMEQGSPADSEVRYLLAFLRYQQGRLGEALQAVQGLLAREPGLAKALLLHGILLHATGKPAEALSQLSAAAARDPGNVEAWYSRGMLLAGMARHEEALASFDKANAIRPTPDCWNSRARVLQDMERFDEALASCDRALSMAPDSIVAWNERGNALLRLGRFAESLASYDRALALQPGQSLGWTNRGTVLQAMKRYDDAIASYDRALQVAPNYVPAIVQRAASQMGLYHLAQAGAGSDSSGRLAGGNGSSEARPGAEKLEDAQAGFQRAIAIDPNFSPAHASLGNILREQGSLDAAESSFRRAIALDAGALAAHIGLGNVLSDRGDLHGAIACYRRALTLNPHIAETHNNLGNALNDLGMLEEALASYRQALALVPGLLQARTNIAVVLVNQGKLKEAEAALRQIIHDHPGDVSALDKLASLLAMQGDAATAIDIICRSLALRQTQQAQKIFADVIRSSRSVEDGAAIRSFMARALGEPWGRPADLAHACAGLLKQDSGLGPCIARAAAAWPACLSEQELYGPAGSAALLNNPLLCVFLTSSQNPDPDIERFLTMARRILLGAVHEARYRDEENVALIFHGALAQQCFINEYVFSECEDERGQVEDLCARLTGALQADKPVPAPWVAAIAAYRPLGSVPLAGRLLDRQFPEPVMALLEQQILEPQAEAVLRAQMPRLTEIAEGVSKEVQQLYEENPYPRWVRSPRGEAQNNIAGYICRKFPLARFDRRPVAGRNIMIAGCGTGQHSIEVARRFPDAQLLAIDLSSSSLAYAQRKSRQLGLRNIDYAQADILKLGGLKREFDLIESAGVLHHMADPYAGWETLLSLLRPGGFMLVGLYSQTARQDILRARRFIAERRFEPVPEQIRQCRQEIMAPGEKGDLASILKLADFFSISTCRDLLFHIQEFYVTLSGIDAFLRAKGLAFLGFEINPGFLHDYRRRFPDDPAATNLANWEIFEKENPDTFASMYQFWVQKSG